MKQDDANQQGSGYYPMDDEFGYSTILHRWIFNGRVVNGEEALTIYGQRRAKRVDTIYTALRETFEQVKKPGRNTLVIPILMYAQQLRVNGSILLNAIESLCIQGRIMARKLNYPSHVPESWEIVFNQQQG